MRAGDKAGKLNNQLDCFCQKVKGESAFRRLKQLLGWKDRLEGKVSPRVMLHQKCRLQRGSSLLCFFTAVFLPACPNLAVESTAA